MQRESSVRLNVQIDAQNGSVAEFVHTLRVVANQLATFYPAHVDKHEKNDLIGLDGSKIGHWELSV